MMIKLKLGKDHQKINKKLFLKMKNVEYSVVVK